MYGVMLFFGGPTTQREIFVIETVTYSYVHVVLSTGQKKMGQITVDSKNGAIFVSVYQDNKVGFSNK